MAPGRLPRREHVAGIERLGELERARDERAFGGGKAFGERTQRSCARLRVKLDHGNHRGILRAWDGSPIGGGGGCSSVIASTTHCGGRRPVDWPSSRIRRS